MPAAQTLFQTCGRQPTPHKTSEGLLEGARGPTGKELCAAGAGAPRPRVSSSGAEKKGSPAAWQHPAASRWSRTPTAEPAGPRTELPCAAGKRPPRRSPSRASPQGSGLSPARGGAVRPFGTSFVAGRRCHFLLLARRSGSWPERYRSASRVKRPPAKR